MIEARRNFIANIERAEAIGQVHAALSEQVTSVIDLSDLLRFEISQSVGAIDCLIHDAVLIGMLEVIQGVRSPTDQFLKFNLSMNTMMKFKEGDDISLIEREIRERHGHLSFQMPDKIAEAFRLISSVDLWTELESRLKRPKKQLKQELSLIVDRRNKIVHEGDLSPVFPRKPWPISANDASNSRKFINKLGHEIISIAELPKP